MARYFPSLWLATTGSPLSHLRRPPLTSTGAELLLMLALRMLVLLLLMLLLMPVRFRFLYLAHPVRF